MSTSHKPRQVDPGTPLPETGEQVSAGASSERMVESGSDAPPADRDATNYVAPPAASTDTHGTRYSDAPADPHATAYTPTSGATENAAGRLPRRFGGYELLEELGHGGMGVVYKARQLAPERLVALKVIRSGELADAEDVRRFRQEADEAARLDHPHIVPVYEVGEHGGLHFFTMKLVEGGSLSQHLERYQNDPKAAAKLMATAARAVHYAHQRQLLHRDLKPGNILLDAAGQPHVADFGLAKRMEEGDACVTRSNAVVGTPEFMAPEQARGEKRLTTAADVYALGGVLYALLTGRPPFRGATGLVIQKVLTEEPTPPSKERPGVPRDLETICLKCLRKEPGRRYASASELETDLGRFLNDEPIQARASTVWERAVKWARRQPAAAALLGVILAGSFSLVLIVFWHQLQMMRANESLSSEKTKAVQAADEAKSEKTKAVQAANEAKDSARKAEAFATLLADLLSGYEAVGFKTYGFHNAPPRAVGAPGRLMLDHAAERVRADLQDQPGFQATLLDTLGNDFRSLGECEKARGLLEEGLTIRRAHLGDDHLDTAMSLFHLGWLHHDLGDYTEAERFYDQALAIQKKLRGGDDPLVADTLFNLAWLKALQYPDSRALEERTAEAERLFREVLRIRQAQAKPNQHDIAFTSLAIATVLLGRGAELEALGLIADASRLLGKEGEHAGSAGNVFITFLKAEQLRKNGNYDEAERQHRQVLEYLRGQLGDRHPITALALGNLAGLLRKKGNLVEAKKLIREALDIGRHGPWRWHPMLADADIQLADTLRDREGGMEAEQLYREAITILQRRLPDNRPMYDQAVGKLKSLLRKQGREKEAEELDKVIS
jgi:serine/threonine protein kinase